MLDALRRGAQGWLAKLLFAILIVSFGIFWNVSDVFRGFGPRVRRARRRRRHHGRPNSSARSRARFVGVTLEGGRRLTTEQALMLRLDRQALDRLDRAGGGQDPRRPARAVAVRRGAGARRAQGPEFRRARRQVLAHGLRRAAAPDERQRAGLPRAAARRRGAPADFGRACALRSRRAEADGRAICTPSATRRAPSSSVQIDAKKIVGSRSGRGEAHGRPTRRNKAEFMTPEYRKVAVLVLSADVAQVGSHADRRRAQDLLHREQGDLRQAGAPAHPADRLQGQGDGRSGAQGTRRRQEELPRRRQGDGRDRKRRQPRPDREDGPDRSQDRGRGVRARARQDLGGGRRTLRDRAVRAIEIRAGQGQHLRRGHATRSATSSPGRARAGAASRSASISIDEARNAGKTLKEIGEEQKLQVLRRRGGGRQEPDAGRQDSARNSGCGHRAQGGVRDRRRDAARCRGAAERRRSPGSTCSR